MDSNLSIRDRVSSSSTQDRLRLNLKVDMGDQGGQADLEATSLKEGTVNSKAVIKEEELMERPEAIVPRRRPQDTKR